jgi:hypothetical protein
MRWLRDKKEFEKVLLEAYTCVYVDSGRRSTNLRRWIFDDAQTTTPEFGNLVQELLNASRDAHASYIVLRPDPVHYFWQHFHKYPAFEIQFGDTTEDYLQALHQDPGESPADAIGTNCWEWVIVPPSAHWFVHVLRDAGDSGGHLWIPEEWTEKVATHRYLGKED